MKIQEQDIYHGPALMQIVVHPSFKALNKADGQYGHYQVNASIRVWAKYSTAGDAPWTFTFQPTDLAGIRADIDAGASVFIALACGHQTICCLSHDQFAAIVDASATAQQWIKVDAPAGKQMRVTGSANSKSPSLVPHNSFPGCIFGS